MAPLARRGERHDDFVAFAGPDLMVATGAAVRLHGFVRLDVPHVDGFRIVVGVGQRGSAAHTTSNATTRSATATRMMSLRRLACGRNGFRPMRLRYRP
jgi:hypothetical protein